MVCKKSKLVGVLFEKEPKVLLLVVLAKLHQNGCDAVPCCTSMQAFWSVAHALSWLELGTSSHSLECACV